MTPAAAAGLVLVGAVAVVSGRARRQQHARLIRSRIAGSLPGGAKPPAQPGRVPWLEWSAPPWVTEAWAGAELPWSVERAVVAWVGAVTVAGLLSAVAIGPGGGVLVGVAGGAAPLVLVRSRVGRREQRLERRLPAALEAVAAAVRSGDSLPDALAAVARASTGSGALDDDLAHVVADLGLGATFGSAIARWRRRRPLASVRLATAALAVGATAGGAQARAIDGVAATLRERAALAREVAALSTQARASAAVIVAAPVAFGFLGLLSGPGVGAFLLTSPAGLGCLTAGLTLDGAGALWIRRMTRRAA